MNRLWEIVLASRGRDRFYCFPFLLIFRLITPLYQFFSRRNLRRRRAECSGGWGARVISIGNISVGGTGKSPITVWLARRLIENGKRVVIVHSGYGRKNTDELIIGYGESGRYPVDYLGDEPAMMARMVPQAGLAVGRDKKKMVSRADERLSPDFILIDDGFQRLDIAKDLDAAVVNAMILGLDPSPMAGRYLRAFPNGILREPLEALRRADSLFIIDSDEDNSTEQLKEAARKLNSSAKIIVWRMYLKGAEIDGESVGLDRLTGRKPFLFAGIGSFDRLKAMCRQAGFELAGDYSLGDHAQYDKLDIDMLVDLARESGADSYLTTAKDLVKLPPQAFDRPLYCLDLAV